MLIALAIFLGWRSGFIIQATALVGFIGGLALLVVVAAHIADLVADMDPWLRTVLVISVLGGVVILAQAIGGAAGSAIRRRLGSGILSRLDQAAGAVFGAARGLFMVWLIGGLVGLLPVPAVATEARQSTILRALETRLPSPVVIAAELGRISQAAGLPDVLVGAPPPIGVPVDGPPMAEAEQIAAAARRSTVRVEAIACGRFLSGTGFAINGDHFFTNAHVVAGAEQLWVSFDGSLDRYSARVVEFDPRLDAALLYVNGISVAPLELSNQLPSRGEPAAALGFTGGGRQRLIPAVISRNFSAIGRDIYGGSVATREIIEMRADVAPGDSGGPVLVPSGQVGGITFSEARADPSIGYALSPVEVAASIANSLRSASPVATGACIH